MGKREIVIIGGGGHSRVIIGMLEFSGIPLLGLVTSDASLLGLEVLGVPVLGLEDQVALDRVTTLLINGVGNHASGKATGLAPRMLLYLRYRARGFDFLPVISNDAAVQPHVTLGEGVVVMPGAVIQPGAMIGENSIINTRASIDHDVVIAPHCHLAPGALLCGGVSVGEATHIGAGAIIRERVRIGRNVLIGAGATITRDVPDDTCVHHTSTLELTKLAPLPV